MNRALISQDKRSISTRSKGQGRPCVNPGRNRLVWNRYKQCIEPLVPVDGVYLHCRTVGELFVVVLYYSNIYGLIRICCCCNMFIQREQIRYSVSAEALVFRPFYNTGLREHALWGCPVLLVFSTGYSVQWVGGGSWCICTKKVSLRLITGWFFWVTLHFHVVITFQLCFILCNVVSDL